ncbi:MAG: type II secretion system protein [Gammaproteobacteria bacterium]
MTDPRWSSISLCRGFTLLETAIVLVIAAIILVAVLRGEALIDQARVSDLDQITRDLANATREFKNRYHYLPGDLLNANTDLNFTPPWAPPPGPCDIPPAATSGDGLINTATEINCVLPHLFFAGYIKSVEMLPAAPFMRITRATNQGILGMRVVATAASNFAGVAGYPPTPTIQHIVEFSNVPLEMAQDLDRKLDDGNLNTGTVQADANPPVDPVAFLAVPLQR